jgi:hypothetical protein
MSEEQPMSHERLEDAIAKANAAAERLVRCAESISNPVYSVVMRGHQGELQILAVRHFQGQIILTVESPFNEIPGRQPKVIDHGKVLEHNPNDLLLAPSGKCYAIYGSTSEGICPICGCDKRDHGRF